jgi:Fic family protein
MRKYEETHPWITFGCNLREADPRLWIALGEAASKCEHISNVPLRPTTAQQLHFVYLAKGVAATTAIEGNTLSEDEVMKAIEGRLDTSPSKRYQQQEVENVIGVCNEICRQVKAGALPDLSTDLLCAYNRRVLKDLEVGEEVVPGELRSHSVVVGNVYRGAPAEDGPFLLDRLFEWLNGNDFKAPEGSQPCLETAFAIIRAIVAHLYLAWIHPFADGNGRTAR